MKLQLLSDLHGYWPKIDPNVDAIIMAGDYYGGPPYASEEYMKGYYETLRVYLEEIKVPVFAIAGNHDVLFERETGYAKSLPWTYLENEWVEWRGLKIFGTPYSSFFRGAWSFEANEREFESILPSEKVDILIVHGPPYGLGDFSLYGNEHTGSNAVRKYIEDYQPGLVVCGHIHEGRGSYTLNHTDVVNVSYLNQQYRPYKQESIIYEL